MQITPLLHPEIIMLRPSDMGYLFELINTYNRKSTSNKFCQHFHPGRVMIVAELT